MSGVINKQVNDKRYKKEYISFYNLSNKPFLPIQRSHIAAKKIYSLIYSKTYA